MKYRRSFSAPARAYLTFIYIYTHTLYSANAIATCVIVINKQFVKAKTILMK